MVRITIENYFKFINNSIAISQSQSIRKDINMLYIEFKNDMSKYLQLRCLLIYHASAGQGNKFLRKFLLVSLIKVELTNPLLLPYFLLFLQFHYIILQLNYASIGNNCEIHMH